MNVDERVPRYSMPRLLCVCQTAGAAIFLCIATSVCVAPASANIVTFTDQGTFDAATSSLTTVTFDGLAPTGSFTSYSSGSVTLSGATFTNSTALSGSELLVVDPGYYGYTYPSDFMTNDFSSTGSDTITVTLPSPETAVGFNYGSLFTGGANIAVNLDSTGPLTASTGGSIQSGTLGFLGFTSTTPFTTVTLTLPDQPNYGVIDNFSFGSAGTSAVPEPSELLPLWGGIGLLAAFARRRFGAARKQS
jgi:hypothetical protein